MIDVGLGVSVGNFDVSIENNGEIVAHGLSEVDNSESLFGEFGIFFIRVFWIVPLVIKRLFADKRGVEAVDADDGNIFVAVVVVDLLDRVVDLVERLNREEIFTIGVVSLLSPAPRESPLAIDVKNDGVVGVERLEGEGFAGSRVAVNENRSSQ